jgi:hypothetical protein
MAAPPPPAAEPEAALRAVEPHDRRSCARPPYYLVWNAPRDGWECDVVPIDDPTIVRLDGHRDGLVPGRVCHVHLLTRVHYLSMVARVRQKILGNGTAPAKASAATAPNCLRLVPPRHIAAGLLRPAAP